MAFAKSSRGRLNDAQAQIIRLQEQVESLVKDRVSPTISDFAGRAETAVNSATTAVRDQTASVSSAVKSNPLIGIGISAIIGWIIGRIMR